MRRETIPVTGMSCTGCEQNVESALGTLDGISRVEADHEADTVEVVADDEVTDDDLRAAIERAGYEASA
ncbi:MAG: heavy-metal-associated domain-containing protein [Haloferacaceae archaeon]